MKHEDLMHFFNGLSEQNKEDMVQISRDWEDCRAMELAEKAHMTAKEKEIYEEMGAFKATMAINERTNLPLKVCRYMVKKLEG